MKYIFDSYTYIITQTHNYRNNKSIILLLFTIIYSIYITTTHIIPIKMSSINKSAGCVYCRRITGSDWQSHQIKNEYGEVICPYAIDRNTCKYCKVYGHKIATCPRIAEKERLKARRAEKREQDFPPLVETKAPTAPGAGAAGPGGFATSGDSFAKKIAENRPAKMTAILEKEAESRQIAEANAKRKKHEDLLNRKEKDETRHVQAMIAKYGSTWYRWVHGTDNDCNTAYKLRCKEEIDSDIIEEKTKKHCNEQEELYKRFEQEMTPIEFSEWNWEREDDYHNDEHRMRTEFSVRASSAALAYYQQTGLMHSNEDFVSDEYGAELKTDRVLRLRKEREAAKKEEETRLLNQCVFKFVKSINKKR